MEKILGNLSVYGKNVFTNIYIKYLWILNWLVVVGFFYLIFFILFFKCKNQSKYDFVWHM